MSEAPRLAGRVRQRIEIRGIVQGVGFRPFVYRLAHELCVDGWVRNDADGVTIEVEGDSARVDQMARRLRDEAPSLARIDDIARHGCVLGGPSRGFAILQSQGGRADTAIGPDTAVCDECLEELFDPDDRRYRYPFINCTNCGPRYTIVRSLPYDRATTSMASFVQCSRCLSEYRSPVDRRFHAEPNACPVCGPRVALLDSNGRTIETADAVAAAVAALRRGDIPALKGIGGFHLACDARNAEAIARLRERKSREEKPFAVMVANVPSVASLAWADAREETLLASPERPIVLLRKGAVTHTALRGVAPGLERLGVMLPYTPLHYLLFHEAAGRPEGTAWLGEAQPLVLVMTSANPGGEPLVTQNDEALVRLARIADCYLMHDRAIVTRADDSVVRVVSDGSRQFIRRARGYTPKSIRLAAAGPCVVALGGHLKSTICVTRGDEAFMSQHIGDLDNAATCHALVESIAHLTSLLGVAPALVAHDLHPDFFSSRHAARLASQLAIPACAIQHHHAHIAAIAAEHHVETPLLGLALDGFGLGSDGTAWGGELLWVDGARCERLGRLRPLRLPGGDRAARQPWRMGAAVLALNGRGAEIARRFADEPAARSVETMLERGMNAPYTSSMGRWFDAAAGLLGLCRRVSFEGQAAMLLEGLAAEHGPVPPGEGLFAIDDSLELDLSPLLLRLADQKDVRSGAALFHATLVAALADWATRAAARRSAAVVACGGGCFLNAIMARGLRRELEARGIAMLDAACVPPNDGGLSLGQAWVAAKMARN